MHGGIPHAHRHALWWFVVIDDSGNDIAIGVFASQLEYETSAHTAQQPSLTRWTGLENNRQGVEYTLVKVRRVFNLVRLLVTLQ
jgi:hypothetical protein